MVPPGTLGSWSDAPPAFAAPTRGRARTLGGGTWARTLRTGLALWFLTLAATFAAEPVTVASGPLRFDIPGGEARPMLRRFARQAKREIMFPVDDVRGIETNPIVGRMTVAEALARMLAETGLHASIDPITGAVAVRREPGRPLPVPAASKSTGDHAGSTSENPGARRSAGRPGSSSLVPPGRGLSPDAPGTSRARPPLIRLGASDSTAAVDAGPIVLSEFRVDTTKDRGYRATNSISGTRLDTPLKDLPMPVEVITADFIADIGAVDAREALAFSAGVLLDTSLDSGAGQNRPFDFSPSGSGGAFNPDSDYKLRGFTTNVTLRNGFIVRPPNDSANISRVEVVRGPAALLYGHSILAGVINIIPKYPRSTPAYTASIAGGAFGLYRATADLTGPLLHLAGRPVDYRLNAAYQQRGDWTDHLETRSVFVAPAFELPLFPRTHLFVDLELRDLRRQGGQFQDLEAPNAGFDRFNRLATYGRDLFHRGPGFRWSGPDSVTHDRSTTALVQLEHRFGDAFSLLASHHRFTHDRTQRTLRGQAVQTDSEAIPEVFRTPLPLGGPGFEAIRYEWNTQPEDTLIASTRIEGNLRFDLRLPWIGTSRHRLLFGRQDMKQTIDVGQSGRAGGQDFSWKRSDDPRPFAYQGETYIRLRDREDERWQTGHYGVYQGKFWRDRVQLVGGLRFGRHLVRVVEHDYIDGQRRSAPRGALPEDPPVDQRGWNTGAAAAAANLPGARSSDTPISAGYRFGGVPQYQRSPTFGVSVRLHDAVSLYGLTATGLVPNPGQRDGRGQNFAAETTRSREAGLKFDLWGGRISGTVSFFEIQRDNAIWFYSFAPAPRSNRTQPGGGGFDPRVPRSFGVYRTTVQAVAALNGRPDFVPARPVTNFDDTAATNAPDATDWVLNYETMRARDSQPGRFGLAPASEVEAKIMRESVEAMLTGELPNGTPNPVPDATLTARNDFLNRGGANWTGNSRGSDTAFGDRATGWDAQMIISPADHWQMVVGYANIRRTVSKGFRFVDFEDLTDGLNYGTEYDLWVNRFGGPERFTDPLRASSGQADTLVGLNLDDSPRHTFTLWNNYRLTRGLLAGTSMGLGLIWIGERQSTAPIGGGNLGVNRFPNPPVPARTEYRLALGYRTQIGERTWNFRLNVNNLLDDRKDEANTSTFDELGGTVDRRTVRYYRPRDVRLTATVEF